MRLRITTIGVYGFDEPGFFAALQRAGVDTFCDIRLRRGVRGRAYAFANSRRLQGRLAELGIRYVHFKDLAPSREVRARQAAADKARGVAKRERTELGQEFIAGYQEECLCNFDSEKFLARLPNGAQVIALFCVEGLPSACHRSLLAERLRQDLHMEVSHITPA